jgi:hypothetical protein
MNASHAINVVRNVLTGFDLLSEEAIKAECQERGITPDQILGEKIMAQFQNRGLKSPNMTLTTIAVSHAAARWLDPAERPKIEDEATGDPKAKDAAGYLAWRIVQAAAKNDLPIVIS